MSPPTRRTPGADPGFAQDESARQPDTVDGEGTAPVDPGDVCADAWACRCWPRGHELDEVA